MSNNNLNMNKISFWTIVVLAAVFLVSIILSFLPRVSAILWWVLACAEVIAVLVVAVLAWRHVSHDKPAMKVLYVVALLVVLVGIIIPRVI